VALFLRGLLTTHVPVYLCIVVLIEGLCLFFRDVARVLASYVMSQPHPFDLFFSSQEYFPTRRESMLSSFIWLVWPRFRVFVGVVVVAVLVGSLLSAQVSSAQESDGSGGGTVVASSFDVGGVTAQVDERTGRLGVGLSKFGAGVGVSYSQDLAATGVDVYGFGVGWGLGITRVVVDGGVRVSTPSGGVYEADAGLLKVWLSSSCGDWSSLEG
jgi:hypothetical protein